MSDNCEYCKGKNDDYPIYESDGYVDMSSHHLTNICSKCYEFLVNEFTKTPTYIDNKQKLPTIRIKLDDFIVKKIRDMKINRVLEN